MGAGRSPVRRSSVTDVDHGKENVVHAHSGSPLEVVADGAELTDVANRGTAVTCVTNGIYPGRLESAGNAADRSFG